MSLVVHLSDPHFGTETPEVVEALLAFVREADPELIVLSGDITQRARRAQFARAAEFARRLPGCPLLVIPGNHDIPLYNVWARFTDPYRGFRRAFGDDIEPTIDLPSVLAIGVNTTRRGRHVDGEVSADQIARTCERLRASPSGQLRIVAVHQPVDVPRVGDEHNLLHNAAEAVVRWAQAGADLVLAGHIHLPSSRRLALRYGERAHGAWSLVAGTSVSQRTREGGPNSINLIRYERSGAARRCLIERCDYAADVGRFRGTRVERLVLRDAAGGEGAATPLERTGGG